MTEHSLEVQPGFPGSESDTTIVNRATPIFPGEAGNKKQRF